LNSFTECTFAWSVQINNAGTNKGFRPLLQFTDEEINQVCFCHPLLHLFLSTAFQKLISSAWFPYCLPHIGLNVIFA